MTKVNLTFIMVTFGNYMSNKKSNGFKNRSFIIIKLHFTGKNVLPIKSECYFYILNACFDAEKKVFFCLVLEDLLQVTLIFLFLIFCILIFL